MATGCLRVFPATESAWSISGVDTTGPAEPSMSQYRDESLWRSDTGAGYLYPGILAIWADTHTIR